MGAKRIRHAVSTAFIMLGILMLTLSIAWQAYYYPWRALAATLGLVPQGELPDPRPIPEMAVQVSAGSFQASDDTVASPNTLGSFFTPRPEMAITAAGYIKLPSIGISENLVEGGGDELFYGVGHIPGSAAPGEAGNCVLAGHRNYYIMHPFRHLDKLEPGDEVELRYADTKYRYEVLRSFVVTPDDLSVLGPQPDEPELLTLVTCTPVLNPVNRLIVWCRPK